MVTAYKPRFFAVTLLKGGKMCEILFDDEKLIRIFYDEVCLSYSAPVYMVKKNNWLTCSNYSKSVNGRAKNLCEKLNSGTFFFKPFYGFEVLANNKSRIVNIPSIDDALVLKYISSFLDTKIDELYLSYDYNFGFRKGKCHRDAVTIAHKHICSGYNHVIKTDIVDFAKSIDHSVLLDVVKKHFGESSLLSKYIKRFLSVGYIDDKDKYHKNSQGLPQGICITQRLLTLFLLELDSYMDCFITDDFQYIRYADDILLLSKSESGALSNFERMKCYLRDFLKLEVYDFQSEKFQYTELRDQGEKIDFLGYSLSETHICLTKKKINKLKRKILDIVYDDSYGRSIDDKISAINIMLIGRNDNRYVFVFNKNDYLKDLLFVNDVGSFDKIDKWVRNILTHYYFNRYKIKIKSGQLSELCSLLHLYRYRQGYWKKKDLFGR